MTLHLWVKAFHLVFVVTWFAGLFYLPRLFVYHARAQDRVSIERFKTMERKLYFGIMTPSAVIAAGLGVWLIAIYGTAWLRVTTWFHLKLLLVGILIGHHVYLGRLMRDFAADRNRHSHVFYRWINEFPTAIVLIAVMILAVVKPSF